MRHDSNLPPGRQPLSDESRKPPGYSARQVAIAMELPFAFVVPVIVGGTVGYFADKWLGTSPLFLIALGLLGLYAGLRELFRRLGHLTQKNNGRRNS